MNVREPEMRDGAVISGVMHLVILIVALFGFDLFADRDPVPYTVTEVELIDGTDFEARLSTAPVVPNKGPAELQPENREPPQPKVRPQVADTAVAAPEMPQLAQAETPDQPKPDLSSLLTPPPPTVVPTEAPRPSIAEIPSPDPLTRQSAEPESRPSTEPLQPLASARAPDPAPRPAPPPEPEPVAVPEPQPEPEKPVQDPQPEATAEAQPEAPLAAAPQEARLPVARPADLAAASQASSAPAAAPAAPKPEEAPKPAETPKPAKPEGGSTSQFASLVTAGEKDALRLGIKQYFLYNGNTSDRSLQVTVAIELDQSARIVKGPELISASGGDQATQDLLFRSGRAALLKAQNAGVFAKLPPDKYEGWRLIHVTFTPDRNGIGFST